jgi:kynureninase
MIAGFERYEIAEQVAKLGDEPLTEAAVFEHIRPLFTRVIEAENARGEVYLANHSLGRPLDRTADDVQRAVDLWYERMDRNWEGGGWLDAVERFRVLVARLIGLSREDAVIPKTSAGQGLRAVLNALPLDESTRPIRVVATRGEFDSVDFILKMYAAKSRAHVTWVEPTDREGPVPLYEAEAILAYVGEDTDLVVLSEVFFTTGQVLGDLTELITRLRAKGPMVLLDMYHGAGVLPVSFEETGADFAIGGSYKYTRGGPGACWMAIHPRHLKYPHMRTLDTGWFAKRDTFSYLRTDEPLLSQGGDAWLESTPPILTAYQALAGLEFTLAVGVERLRDYSLRQQDLLRTLMRASGVPIFHPAEPERFGGFTLLPHPAAMEVAGALREARVNVDARGDFVRFGPDLLTTTGEMERAAVVTRQVLGDYIAAQPILPPGM